LSYYDKEIEFAIDGTALPNKKVGGLRIKKISTVASASDLNPIIKTYSYRNNSGISTGKVLSVPLYSYPTKVYACDKNGTCGTFDYIVNSSSSNVTLGTAAGSTVSYTSVIVANGENAENGLESHFFSFYPDLITGGFPFGPSTTFDHLRGLEQQKTVYKKTNSIFSPVDDVQNSYKTDAFAPTKISGLKVGYRLEGWNTGYNQDLSENYALGEFEEQTNWLNLETTQHRIYDSESANYTQSQQSNIYGLNHLQLIKQTGINSDGTVFITELKYPADYPTATGALAEMRDSRNMQNSVVEKLNKVQRSGDSDKLLQGTLNTYATITSTGSPAVSRVVLQSVSQTELSSPSTAAPVYVEQQSFSYDNSANMIEAKRKGNRYTSYVWGYNAALPIAEIQNATASEVQAQLSTDGTLSDAATIRNVLNGLRSQLPLALVTGYTYIPHIGIESTTTPASLTTYYEYDKLARLERIRNNNHDIIKEYAYAYRGPNPLPNNDETGNQPPSQSGSIPDQTIGLNQAFTYTIPSNLFTDPEGEALTYSINGLPNGLSFTNGVITGTTTMPGDFLITLTATDSDGLSSSTSFFLTVSTCSGIDPYIVTGTFSSSTPVSLNAINRMETDDNQPVTINQEATVLLKAGQLIQLKPGFTIKPGATFRAYNGPCN
jgi:hypothetical protein